MICLHPHDIPSRAWLTRLAHGFAQGAQIEHSQLCTHLKTWGDTVGLDQTSRVFQFSAHVFDAVIDEVFLPLIYGGIICIPSDDDRMK